MIFISLAVDQTVDAKVKKHEEIEIERIGPRDGAFFDLDKNARHDRTTVLGTPRGKETHTKICC